MITGAILGLCGWLMGVIADLLPLDDLELDAIGDIGTWFATHAGPLDRFLPVYEMAAFLVIFFGVWCPAAVIYTIVKWTYKHLPVLGKG